MKRNAQISIFMVLGIVIVIIFIFMFYLVSRISSTRMQSQAERIASELLKTTTARYYVNICLEDAVRGALNQTIMQGGYIYPDQPGSMLAHPRSPPPLRYQGTDVSYQVLLPKDSWGVPYYPCFSFGAPAEMCIFRNELDQDWTFGSSDLPKLHKSDAPTYMDLGWPSIQEQLEKAIENRTRECVNFNIFSEHLGYNVNEGNITAEVTISDYIVTTQIRFPLVVSINSRDVQTTVLKFENEQPVRLKLLYGVASDIIAKDNSYLSFDIGRHQYGPWGTVSDWPSKLPAQWRIRDHPGVEVFKTGARGMDSVVILNDTLSRLGNEPFMFQFAVRNRIPALDYIPELPNTNPDYDLIVTVGATIDITPKAGDPDEEDPLYYNYSAWKETYDEYFDIPGCQADPTCGAHPEDFVRRIIGAAPHNWTISLPYQNTKKDASYTTVVSDIGPHVLNVSVTDTEFTDYQEVRILVDDQPQAKADSYNCFADIDNVRASIEDCYVLDARASVNIMSAGPPTYEWQDEDEVSLPGNIGQAQILDLTPPIDEPKATRFNYVPQGSHFWPHNIVLVVYDSGNPYSFGKLDPPMPVEVFKCLPHRNDSQPYPFHTTADPFQANHTCCEGEPDGPITLWKLSGKTDICFTAQEYSCRPDPDKEVGIATKSLKDATDSVSAELVAYDAFPTSVPAQNAGNNNDIYMREFVQNCGSNRGNACSGEYTDTWVVVEQCDDSRPDQNDGTKGERCMGPCDPATGCHYDPSEPTESCTIWDDDPGCFAYRPGQSFEYSYMGNAGTDGYCDNDWQCVGGYGNNQYAGTTGNWLARGQCDGSGTCDYAKGYNCNVYDHYGADGLDVDDDVAVGPYEDLPSQGSSRICRGSCFTGSNTGNDLCKGRDYTCEVDQCSVSVVQDLDTPCDPSTDGCPVGASGQPEGAWCEDCYSKGTRWLRSGEPGSFGEYANRLILACCGDDQDEYPITNQWTGESMCCDSSTDCTNSTLCTDHWSFGYGGGDGSRDFCNFGAWYDCKPSASGARYACKQDYCDDPDQGAGHLEEQSTVSFRVSVCLSNPWGTCQDSPDQVTDTCINDAGDSVGGSNKLREYSCGIDSDGDSFDDTPTSTDVSCCCKTGRCWDPGTAKPTSLFPGSNNDYCTASGWVDCPSNNDAGDSYCESDMWCGAGQNCLPDRGSGGTCNRDNQCISPLVCQAGRCASA